MLWAQHTLLSKRGLGIQLLLFRQWLTDSSLHALLTKSIQMRWQLADIHNFVGILCLLAIVWLTPAGRILNSAGDSWSRHTVLLQQRTLTVPVTLGSDALSFFWLTYTLNFHWLHHFLCSQTLYSCQLDVVIGCVIYSQTPSFCTDLETVASDRPCHCRCCTVLTLTVRLSYIHWLTVRS